MLARVTSSQKRWLLLAIVFAVFLAAGAIFFSFGDHGQAAASPELVGDWTVTYKGRSQGTVTLLPSGRTNSYDNFEGRWRRQGAGLYIEFWENPDTLQVLLSPRHWLTEPEGYLFLPKSDSAGGAYVFQNETTVLRKLQ